MAGQKGNNRQLSITKPPPEPDYYRITDEKNGIISGLKINGHLTRQIFDTRSAQWNLAKTIDRFLCIAGHKDKKTAKKFKPDVIILFFVIASLNWNSFKTGYVDKNGKNHGIPIDFMRNRTMDIVRKKAFPDPGQRYVDPKKEKFDHCIGVLEDALGTQEGGYPDRNRQAWLNKKLSENVQFLIDAGLVKIEEEENCKEPNGDSYDKATFMTTDDGFSLANLCEEYLSPDSGLTNEISDSVDEYSESISEKEKKFGMTDEESKEFMEKLKKT
jgi:hypothetical protein